VEMYDLMCKRFYEIAEVACQSENRTKSMLTQLNFMCASLDLPIFNIVSSTSQQVKEKLTHDATPTTDNMVRSPLHVKSKVDPEQIGFNQ